MARRADAAPINRVPWVGLKRKVPGLQVFPPRPIASRAPRRLRRWGWPSTRAGRLPCLAAAGCGFDEAPAGRRRNARHRAVALSLQSRLTPLPTAGRRAPARRGGAPLTNDAVRRLHAPDATRASHTGPLDMTCNSAFPAARRATGPLGHRPGRRQLSAQAQTPPEPGASERIDAIRKAGVLRVGVVTTRPGWCRTPRARASRGWVHPGRWARSSPSCWA